MQYKADLYIREPLCVAISEPSSLQLGKLGSYNRTQRVPFIVFCNGEDERNLKITYYHID